jgi:geranylgeranyl diphosphate/geranylgeranyl-bacteriochlorophyllide a reductase
MERANERFDVVVVGGGPAGATAASELADRGLRVALLDRGGRIKPCGGAVPPQLLRDFNVPTSLLVDRIDTARIRSPRGQAVDIPIHDGYVGMVDRGTFDEWLRERAERKGAVRERGLFEGLAREPDGTLRVRFARPGDARRGGETCLRTRFVIGADGATSKVARQAIPGAERNTPSVFAYHEIVASPTSGDGDGFLPGRAEVAYDERLSPDFYGWIFPHGETTSVGVGTARSGFGMREAVSLLRTRAGLAGCETIRREGAPIPMQALRRWDNGRDVLVVGDAAGVVAPSSGEGIFYAMASARFGAESVLQAAETGRATALRRARGRFMRAHGRVFFALAMMQRYWYRDDGRRERFVAICRDPDVQRLTFDGYMNKRLVRSRPLTHARIFLKNVGHLTGWLPA